MRTLIALGLALGVGMGARPAHGAAPAELQPLSFLLGDWLAGPNTGPKGESTGRCSFRLSLQDRVMVLTNHAKYPASGGNPGLVHDDLMIIYRIENGEVRADCYDNEGHVIHYRVIVAQGGDVTFRNDPSAAGPGYRLKYKLRQYVAVQGDQAP